MNSHGPLRWVRVNLFANPLDTTLSLVFIPVCAAMAWQLAAWALTQAQWSVVTDNLRVLMIGTFPGELTSRTWISAAILSALSGATLGAVAGGRLWLPGAAIVGVIAVALLGSQPTLGLAAACVALSLACAWVPHRWVRFQRWIALAWLLAIIAIGLLLAPAGSERWGGLLMSVIVTLLGSVLSIPLGAALALGRRSRFASARVLCTGYIEVMRSLPLILIVYWVWVVTPLLAPSNPMPDLLRGLVAFTLFFAAYVAEYVRSGLQSVPRGQVEAAQSLGMSAAQVNRDVVLPQAVRVVTPALVGNVLDVFNTVPLLFIIGLTDFLRAGQMVLVNPQSGGRTYEMYVFMFVVYLAIASLITFGARRLEARMAHGHQ
jgi:general L-amino acid transport system permease protein